MVYLLQFKGLLCENHFISTQSIDDVKKKKKKKNISSRMNATASWKIFFLKPSVFYLGNSYLYRGQK